MSYDPTHGKGVLAVLKELRPYIALERFSARDQVTLNGDAEVTAFIKHHVIEIHHNSWVLPKLDALIARLEAQEAKRKARRKR